MLVLHKININNSLQYFSQVQRSHMWFWKNSNYIKKRFVALWASEIQRKALKNLSVVII